MDVRLRWLLRTPGDLVAWWQLRALGWSARRIEDRAWRHGWRAVHRGVYALQVAPLTQEQRWLAGVLTAPGTLLVGPSAVACWGHRAQRGSVVSPWPGPAAAGRGTSAASG